MNSPTLSPPTDSASSKLSAATTTAAVGTAFIASLCCIGPLVFALLGIGGAGLLVKIEPLRPYFAVLTAGLLGAGFYFTYRKPKAAVGPATFCRSRSSVVSMIRPPRRTRSPPN